MNVCVSNRRTPPGLKILEIGAFAGDVQHGNHTKNRADSGKRQDGPALGNRDHGTATAAKDNTPGNKAKNTTDPVQDGFENGLYQIHSKRAFDGSVRVAFGHVGFLSFGVREHKNWQYQGIEVVSGQGLGSA